MDWWAWLIVLVAFGLGFDLHKRVCQIGDRLAAQDRKLDELTAAIYRLRER